MRATVVSVREDTAGTALAANLALTDTAVVVLSAADCLTTGVVLIAGHLLAYTGILYADEGQAAKDTFTLAAGSPVAGTAYVTAVSVPGSVEYIAQVRPRGSTDTLDAVLTPEVAAQKAMEPQPLSGADVECEWRGRGTARRLWLVNLIGRAPGIRPESLSDGVLTAAVSLPNLTIVPPVVETAILAVGAGAAGSGNVAGGHWGDTYGSTAVHGGHWGDTYA